MHLRNILWLNVLLVLALGLSGCTIIFQKGRRTDIEKISKLKSDLDELQRAKDLGYAGKDPEYAALNNEISKVEKQLTDNEDLTAAFSKLKDRLAAFLKRQSEHQRS